MSEHVSSTDRAIRLIFEYDGDTVRLISQQPVDMVVLPTPAGDEPHEGHVVETRDASGAPLARVAVRGGFAQSAEVFPEDHAEPITRVGTEPHGAFTVVVPVQAGSAQVALLKSTVAITEMPGDHAISPAPGPSEEIELATFPLQHQR